MMQLYSYFRSSAAFRVRIALQLKGLPYEHHSVHLLQNGGEHHDPAYVKLNPQHLVPVLVTEKGKALTQSLAIIQYLEDFYPLPSLYPRDLESRAHARAIAQIVACDIHPLDNLRVLQYLENKLGVGKEARTAWYRHWIEEGFAAIEVLLLDRRTGLCCVGDIPTIADICLIPQVYNALRFDIPLDAYPNITRIYHHCMRLPYFIVASPEEQPDADPEMLAAQMCPPLSCVIPNN